MACINSKYKSLVIKLLIVTNFIIALVKKNDKGPSNKIINCSILGAYSKSLIPAKHPIGKTLIFLIFKLKIRAAKTWNNSWNNPIKNKIITKENRFSIMLKAIYAIVNG